MGRENANKTFGGSIPEDASVVIRRNGSPELVVLQCLQPDAVLPEIFYKDVEERTPETRLLIAVLDEAVGLFQAELRHPKRRRKIITDLEYFFFSK